MNVKQGIVAVCASAKDSVSGSGRIGYGGDVVGGIHRAVPSGVPGHVQEHGAPIWSVAATLEVGHLWWNGAEVRPLAQAVIQEYMRTTR
jgi:hypothetical protein